KSHSTSHNFPVCPVDASSPHYARWQDECVLRCFDESGFGTERQKWMSASLIGRLVSSAFRLSTTSASVSLAASCFSSESAPRAFHHGIRRRGGTTSRAALPSV